MKKTYLLLMLSAVMAVSCDMDKEPYDSVPDTEALNSPTSFQSARTGLYSALKSSIAGTFYNAPEIQCDGFDAVTGFSNTLGEMYRWTFTTQTTTFDGVYGNYQAMIARANFIIDTYNKTDFSNKGVFPDEATQTNPGMPAVRAAKGDAFFIRAYSIFMLSQFFCPDYEASNEDTPNLGVSYSLSYNPSKDQTTYPGRYTLKETFDQIPIAHDLINGVNFLLEGQVVDVVSDASTETVLYADMPIKVQQKVTYTEPGLKGDTATNTLKPATVESGATVRVPLFINEGETIEIDTRDGSYVGRVKA